MSSFCDLLLFPWHLKPAGKLSTFPPEIRVKILRNLMCALPHEKDSGTTGAARRCGEAAAYEKHVHRHLSAQLFRTCRSIYGEALPIPYGENVFPTLPDSKYLSIGYMH
jgi:hypothetical protein